jgi:hypothetical protein
MNQICHCKKSHVQGQKYDNLYALLKGELTF